MINRILDFINQISKKKRMISKDVTKIFLRWEIGRNGRTNFMEELTIDVHLERAFWMREKARIRFVGDETSKEDIKMLVSKKNLAFRA